MCVKWFIFIATSFDRFVDVPGVDQPDERNKKGNKEVHNSLFLNNAIVMGVYIFVDNSFNDDGHDSCQEEES